MDITWVWDSVAAYLAAHFYISPFWYWVFLGFVTTCFCVLVSYFFPPLRSVSGAVVLAIIAGLTGYRRAQYDDQKHAERVKPPESPKGDDGWHW